MLSLVLQIPRHPVFQVKAEIVNKAEEENEQELELLAEQAALKAEATRFTCYGL